MRNISTNVVDNSDRGGARKFVDIYLILSKVVKLLWALCRYLVSFDGTIVGPYCAFILLLDDEKGENIKRFL